MVGYPSPERRVVDPDLPPFPAIFSPHYSNEGDGMTDTDLHELVAELHAQLQATEELDIHYTANRWIGEAEAVAADITGDDVSEQVIDKRVTQIEDLLHTVDETENQEANEHIRAARSLAERINERL